MASDLVCLRRGYKMSQLQFLNAFVTERLTAVAVEISAVCEQTIGEYQEEISRSNEENKRLQSLLSWVFNPEIKLHRADSQQPSLPVSEEKVPPEQERSPNLGQEDPEPTQIKEEEEELRTSQEEEQLQGLEPDTKDLFLIPACVKSDYEQDPPLPSHLDQTLENRERDSLPTNTTEQIKTEPGGEDYRVSEPTRDSQLLSAVNPECSAALGEDRICVDGVVEMLLLFSLPPDSQQPPLPVSEEEVPPEQERSPLLGQEDPEPTQIKEEQEELRTSQEEEQLQGLESEIRVSEPTSLCRDSETTISVANPEHVDGVERPILPSFPPSLPVSEEEVPPEQQHCEQERSPLLGQEDPEPTQIKEEEEELRTSQEEEQLQGLESEIRVSEPTSLCRVLEPTSLCRDSETTISVANPEHVDGVERPILPSFPPSLPVSEEEVPPEQQHCEQERSPLLGQEDPDPTQIKEEREGLRTSQEEEQVQGLESEIRVSEPTSLCRVLEPTSLCKVLESTSVANPDYSAAQSEKIEEYVDGLERPILPSYPPELPVSEEEVPPEQQERSPGLGQEDPEPTKVKDKQEELRTSQEEEQLHIGVSEPTSLCRVSEPTLSAANPDSSEAQIENIEEHIDGLERPILPPFSPDSQQPSLPVSKEEVPPEQQERSPGLGQEDPEPTKQEELWTNQEEKQLESDSRVSEPTSDSQLLSAVNPDGSAAQSENSKVHQSPTTSSEQDSSNVESNEASHFSNWTDKNILDTDGNSLDSSSCTKEDSEARKPTKRTCHSSGVVNEPSDLSNLCDENNPGTEISPSDSNKDMNIQTDSGAHNPAKRKCQRVQSPSAEIVCSRDTTPSSAQSSTYVMPMPVTDSRRSKKQYCLYCGKPYLKIARHLQFVHRDEVDVAKAFSFRKNSRERKVMLGLLNKKGNFVHNVAVARCGSGEMVACSRPKVPGSTQDYTHCMHCQGLYNRKTLWKHVRYCPLNPKADEPKPGQKMRIQSAMVFKLCPQPDYVSTGLWKIVCGMNSGEVSFVVRNDKYILLMGEEMYNKLQPDDRRIQFIPQRMREMARLLIAARKCTPLMCFEDLVIPSNLPHVITAVRAVAGYNEENKTYDRPTLAVQMGYNLMNIGSAVESCALKSGRYKVAEFAGKFKGFKWNEVVMAGALSTLSKPKMKCAQPDRHTGTKPPHHTGTSRPITQAPSRPITQAPRRPIQAPSRPVTQAPSRPVTQAPSRPGEETL
ncbi:hypothetical protein J4Q44_G00001060 [Coregonus suidteri]|uniref:Uncharacterized protein n=1 Tax=Coregonus suidteri TaxID=861788 RepID=A0AAN8R8I3_9TELE